MSLSTTTCIASTLMKIIFIFPILSCIYGNYLFEPKQSE
jgi:hypothetical protein